MHGDERDGQAAAITQFGQRRVGMIEHILLKPLQQRAAKCRLASGIRAVWDSPCRRRDSAR